jgi:hypothetical protein
MPKIKFQIYILFHSIYVITLYSEVFSSFALAFIFYDFLKSLKMYCKKLLPVSCNLRCG